MSDPCAKEEGILDGLNQVLVDLQKQLNEAKSPSAKERLRKKIGTATARRDRAQGDLDSCRATHGPASPGAAVRFLVGSEEVPLVAAFVDQEAAGQTIRYVTDANGGVPDPHGSSTFTVYRGSHRVSTVGRAAVNGGIVRLTDTMLDSQFSALRNALIAKRDAMRAPEVINRRIEQLALRASRDYANIFALTGRSETSWIAPAAELVEHSDVHDRSLKPLPPPEEPGDEDLRWISVDNPCIVAGGLAYALCVSYALDGDDGTSAAKESRARIETLLVGLVDYFASLPDASTQTIRRRSGDALEVLARKKAAVAAEIAADPQNQRPYLRRELQLIERAALSPLRWTMELSVDEYSGFALGMSAIGRWAPGRISVETGDGPRTRYLRNEATQLLKRTNGWLAKRDWVLTANVGGTEVIAARGPGALMTASLYVNAAAQTETPRDTFEDPSLVLDSTFPAMKILSEALAGRGDQNTILNDMKLPVLYRRGIQGEIGAMLVAARIATTALGPAGAMIAVPLLADLVTLLGGVGYGILAASGAVGLGPAAVLSVLGKLETLLNEIVGDSRRLKHYASTGARIMTDGLWAYASPSTAAIGERAALSALGSTEVAAMWRQSFPRVEPDKGGEGKLVAVILSRVTQILCGDMTVDVDKLVDGIVDLTTADNIDARDPHLYRVVDHHLTAWAGLCLALAVRPQFDFSGLEEVAAAKQQPPGFAGNARSKELHVSSCEWAKLIAPYNRVAFDRVGYALVAGYQGCRYCLPHLDAS